MEKHISRFLQKVLAGGQLKLREALELYKTTEPQTLSLLEAANQIRTHFRGNRIGLCSIVNAKSGNCPQDCAFCSQSIHHKADIKRYPLISADQILDCAKKSAKIEATRFGIVTSGLSIKNREELSGVCQAIEKIRQYGQILPDASLGTLNKEGASQLKRAGLLRYHHNLETAESFFSNICTTLAFKERVKTVEVAKQTGLEVCCGGVFGLGETPRQRIELALLLRDLDVDSIPLNFLIPIPGTRLENMQVLDPFEILKIIAIFRFLLPSKEINVCGGREANLRGLQSMIFFAGASGMMIGEYLTTGGRDPQKDLRMIGDLGLEIKECPSP